MLQQVAAAAPEVPRLMIWGAALFGAVIGWYVYFINRYRKDDVALSDIVTLIGAIGGAAILALFEARSVLFGAYGIGLAAGFFGYFIVLIFLVGLSKNFNVDYFLDGRRRWPEAGFEIPADFLQARRAMSDRQTAGGGGGTTTNTGNLGG